MIHVEGIERMITTRILPVREVREKMSQLLNETAKGGEPIIITRHGRPVGYLINYEAFNNLLERLEDLEDIRAMREAEATWRAGEGRDFEEFAAELEGAT